MAGGEGEGGGGGGGRGGAGGEGGEGEGGWHQLQVAHLHHVQCETASACLQKEAHVRVAVSPVCAVGHCVGSGGSFASALMRIRER